MEFVGFPKMSRLFRDVVITEKIDGTNAQVTIMANTGPDWSADALGAVADVGEYSVFAGSKNRWLQPGNDNKGFARWVHEHAGYLAATLGEGTHYGEWWGQGIQRKYGMDRKVFSLFNTHLWADLDSDLDTLRVVPVLSVGMFSLAEARYMLRCLKEGGSLAAPGYMNPEGIVVFHAHSNHSYKVTLEGDQHKGV